MTCGTRLRTVDLSTVTPLKNDTMKSDDGTMTNEQMRDLVRAHQQRAFDALGRAQVALRAAADTRIQDVTAAHHEALVAALAATRVAKELLNAITDDGSGDWR